MKKEEVRFMYNKPWLSFYYRILHLILRNFSRLWLPILADGYSPFEKVAPSKYGIRVDNLSGGLHPNLVMWLLPYTEGKSMFFAGEPMAIEPQLKEIFQAGEVTTAGLEGSRYYWDFEHPNPIGKQFDVVYSQSMLEHLLEPYRHLMELATLVKPNGLLAIWTASFLFPYHRTPIHASNIMPDMIEIVAERNNMTVLHRCYHHGNLVYLLRK